MTVTQTPAVDLRDIRYAWRTGSEVVLDGFSMQIPVGSRTFVQGASGSGKTTLLSLLAGIITPSKGTVNILGKRLDTMGGAQRDHFRAQHIGYIFQMFNLLPYASALDNVLLPLKFAPVRRRRAARERPAREEAARLLAALGVHGFLATKSIAARLSVGQQQRVAAARALIGAPSLVIADEPTSALDKKTQESFLDLLFGQVEEAGATLIMVSHDERLTPRFDRALDLGDIATIHHGAET